METKEKIPKQKTNNINALKGSKFKIISWNVRGMNSPQKRKKIFQYLQKQNIEIACLQETHIKQKDIRLLKNKKFGNEFTSSNIKKKKGVVIYVNEKHNSKKVFEDEEGRILGVEVILQNEKCLIVGIYAPLEKKDQFFNKLNEMLINHKYVKTLVLGDWNGVVNPAIDRKSEKKIKKTQGKLPKAFENMIEEQVLYDIWRFKYGNSKDFTYYSERHRSLSRIDMLFATKSWCKDVINMASEPRTISDHSPLILTMKTNPMQYAWRLNDILLQKEEIVEKARKTLSLFFEENINPDIDMTTVWEASKAYMRGFFIQQNHIMKRKKREKMEKLYNLLRQKEKEQVNNLSDKKILKQIKTIKKQIDWEENEEIQRKLKYLKQKYFECSNKPGRWLAHKLKKQRERNIILEIRTKNSICTSKQEDIMKEFTNFYSELYKGKEISEKKIDDFLNKAQLTTFDKQQRELLNGPITTAEIVEVIKKAKNGKTPGPDGFPVEYYKKFEEQISTPFKLTVNAIGRQKYPNTWKQANIILLAKENRDHKDIRNYRPISLLNTDYKLFAMILAERLKKVLKDWISEEQGGFLPNRQLKDNIRHILDTIEYFEYHNEKSLALIFMDLEKAFDNVSWETLKILLDRVKVGDIFGKWVQEIYCEQYAQLIVNQGKSEPFQISKGTRQGCPLSPLLFILVLESLNNRVRIEKNIKGLKIKKYEYKMRLYADDIVYILEDPIFSIKNVIQILEEFQEISGLKVNKEKTVMLTKNMSNEEKVTLVEESGFKLENKVKYLGITLTNKNVDIFHNNYEKVWAEVKKDLGKWGKFQLSLLGKISAIQMNILPRMLFLFQTVPILHSFKPLENWQKEILKFVWDKKKARIKAKILYDEKKRGGLGLPNLKSYYMATVMVWLKEWLLLDDDKLLALEGFNMRFGFHGYLFYDKKKVHKNCVNHVICRTLLFVWEKLKPRLCYRIPQICSPHEAFFGKESIPKLKWLRYRDLIKSNMEAEELKSQEELRQTEIECHWYLYRQLRERWKLDRKMTGINKNITDWEEIINKGKRKLITRYYKLLLTWETEEEIIRESMVRWAQNMGKNLEYAKWVNVWKSMKYTVNQDLKENIYKMTYRWHLSPQKIAFMYKNSSPLCWRCENKVGTYFHMWWLCRKAKEYWLKIYKVINGDLKIQIAFQPEIFLLGMVDVELERLCGKLIFNLLTCARIVFAKSWKCKQIPSIEQWLIKLLEVAEMDKMTSWMKDKDEEQTKKDWEIFYVYIRKEWKNIYVE